MASSRTVYEWKITDLPEGQHGYIWISESGKDEFGAVYSVFVDEANNDSIGKWIGDYRGCNKGALWNILGNLEVPEDCSDYSRILFYWKRLGSPVIDRKAPGYAAPYFPWAEAGFTESEIADFADFQREVDAVSEADSACGEAEDAAREAWNRAQEGFLAETGITFDQWFYGGEVSNG